jgi:predicted nucleic acid-binding protein
VCEYNTAHCTYSLPCNLYVKHTDDNVNTRVFHYGNIRTYLQKSGIVIGSLDMLIAAHALSLSSILVTNNVKEFERVPDLEIENWTNIN